MQGREENVAKYLNIAFDIESNIVSYNKSRLIKRYNQKFFLILRQKYDQHNIKHSERQNNKMYTLNIQSFNLKVQFENVKEKASDIYVNYMRKT